MKSEVTTIVLPRTFQGTCWHCDAFMAFRPMVERHGLRCPACQKLNQYDWSETEFKDWQKAYRQPVSP